MQNQALFFPIREAPAYNSLTEIAPGVRWLRLALPFQLNHINIYLIEDDGGWALWDTGIGDDRTIAAWEELLEGPLKGQRITKVISSHFHPDHMGMAGWLQRRQGMKFWMSQAEYIFCLVNASHAGGMSRESYRNFLMSHGFDDVMSEKLVVRGQAYLDLITGVPPHYNRLKHGDTMRLGGRTFQVMTGGGHALEHLMFYCAADNFLLIGDQVLAKITPNISVNPLEPNGNPLGDYLASLEMLRANVPDDALVLPAHNLPFRGLHKRADQMIAHHAERCDMISKALANGEVVSSDKLVPVVFPRPLDPHQLGFAFSEVLAHVNLMLWDGRLKREIGPDKIYRVRAA